MRLVGMPSIFLLTGIHIVLPGGGQVPLSQLAAVTIKKRLSHVQQYETMQRIMVGFNARDRDVKSITHEVHPEMDVQPKLPPGYPITNGERFSNLARAKQRPSATLPPPPCLLFLSFSAFNSVMKGLAIFTAIPLVAIGGVISLWGGMLFSISADVGFNALFGLAVLIGEFNQLK